MTEAVQTYQEVAQSGPQFKKYLTFYVGKEEFALDIERVQEIIGLIDITRLPRTEDYVRGVINLRGKVIPVIDLRLRFGLPHQEDTVRTCFIVGEVVNTDGRLVRIGLAVDEVAEVVDLDGRNIQDTGEFAANLHGEFVQGIGLIGEEVKLLLDLDKVISANQAELLTRMAQAKSRMG